MKTLKISFVIFISLVCTTALFSQTTSQWRGENRDGSYQSTNLLKQWPEKGPALLWSVERIGEGYSSPVVAGETIVVNGEIDGTGYLCAFNLQGDMLWKSPYGSEYPLNDTSSEKYSGPRATPTITGGMIYICSGLGKIGCFNAQNGSAVWNIDLVRDFNGVMPEGGYAESLLVDGDVLYCYPGGTEKNVAAINRFTGKTIWTSKGIGDSVSYCSPIMIRLPERKILVNLTSEYISGLDAGTGELLWYQKQENMRYHNQFATPVYDNRCIYYISELGNGAVKLELSSDGRNITEMWRTGSIKSGLNSPLKINDFIFYSDVRQKIRCIDIHSGHVVDSLRVFRGPLFKADERLYCYSENGTVSLIKYDGSKMELTSSFKIDKGTREHLAQPYIDKGVMYIRHGNTLLAYDISNE